MKKPAPADAAERKVWSSAKGRYVVQSPVARQALPHLSPFSERLLLSRGIMTAADADIFLDPDYDFQTHDPFLFKDMDKAVDRIFRAIEQNERIAIWSDYDADGIPGAIVLHDLFRKIGYANFVNYIPHRHDEGFGLNSEGIERIATDGARLVITVDCGITDIAEISHAASLGMDTIVTDHHLPSADGLPNAVAIVDHKQEGCTYPDKNLCGAATAFKLAQAVLSRDRFGAKEGWEKWLLDMVGLATLSDMVPLIGENRVFALYGLMVMRKSPRVGLAKLLRAAGCDQRALTEDDVAFTITPRINAASRMGAPMEAFSLLTTDDYAEADRLVAYLTKINDERKGIVASISREAKKHHLERDPDNAKSVIVMGNPDWRPALLGLVANTLAEEFHRPVFLWGRDNGNGLKGSCRSGNGTNVVELMERAKHALIDFGGHRMSGGFSARVDTVHLLEEALAQAYDDLKHDLFDATATELDGELALENVTWKTYRELERLAPYGVGNPKPVFLFRNIEIESSRQFGKGGLHLELLFRTADGCVKAIAFFAKPESFGVELGAGKRVNLVAHIERSAFRGNVDLRLRIVDFVS